MWLLRLGMIGDEFKTARKHLLDNLEGNIAWKSPEQAEAQKTKKKRVEELLVEEETMETENNNMEIDEQEEDESPALLCL